jgi:hypothetical protein
MIPVTGEPLVWFVAVAPVIVVFTLANVTWAALILYYRQWHGGHLWILTGLFWVIAIVIDFAHHC